MPSAAAAVLLRALAVAALAAPAAAVAADWWKPQRYTDGKFTRFQYQLSDEGPSTIRFIPGVQVYAIDFDTAAQAIKRLRGRDPSVKVICYFSAGSWENYRGGEDKNRRGILPSDWLRPDGSSTIGRAMDGWPGERWVDVRSEEVRGVMRKRLDYCRDIGCDGVDPDNVNGHENNTGFKLTKQDLVQYNRWLAQQAHARGMGIGLKNSQDLIPHLHTYFDWAINEECFAYDECQPYLQFASSKPVWAIEYCNGQALGSPTQDPACFCPKAAAMGINALLKEKDLTAAGISCTEYCKQRTCQKQSQAWGGVCPSQQSNICDRLPATPAL